MNPLIEKLRREQGQKGPVLSEAERVANLPLYLPKQVDMTPDLATENGNMSLRDIQSKALFAIKEMGGGFFPIGVGHGKSLIALLAGTVLKSKCVFVFVPASTVGTMEKTLVDFSPHFNMPPNIHILSYSKLSRPEGTSLIDELRGDIPARDTLIVCDEVHRIKRKEASRTKRVLRWFMENEEARFIGLSGTITSKSIKDFSHLITLALRQGSPLPLNNNELTLWAMTLDVPNWATQSARDKIKRHGGDYNQRSINALQPISEWAIDHGMKRPEGSGEIAGPLLKRFGGGGKKRQVEHLREAFRLRLKTTPGVIATSETSVSTSLYISESRPELSEEIKEAVRFASESDGYPLGEAYDSEVAKWRILKQLSWGFYLEWDWGDELPDTDWLIARAAWRKAVYNELMYRADKGYDSPLLVTQKVKRDIENNRPIRGLHRLWMDWDTQRHKPQPPTVATWIDKEFLAKSLDTIASRKHHTAIWVDSKEMQDEAERIGMKVYGAGKKIPDTEETAVLSIASHGIGKNLVQWSHASVLTWPSDGQIVEQLLGRHHRPGQSKDEVWFERFAHTEVFRKAWKSSVEKATYIQQLTGNKQKILLATTVRP